MRHQSIVEALDPQMQTVFMEDATTVAALNAEIAPQDDDLLKVEKLRQLYSATRANWNKGGSAMFKTRELLAPSRTEGVDISVRLHYPCDAFDLPVLFFMHGGGWVMGNNDSHDRIMRTLASFSGWAVAGIEYRLAPETKYPHQIYDCEDAIYHTLSHAHEFGLNPNHFAVGGDSAGARLALAFLLSARDRQIRDKTTPIAKKALLFYGEYGLMDSASHRLWGGKDTGLSKEDMLFFRDCLLNNPVQEITQPAFNLLLQPLEGLPPLHIVSVAMDPLADDSAALAGLAKKAGVFVDSYCESGVLHGYLHYGRIVEKSRLALEKAAIFLNED